MATKEELQDQVASQEAMIAQLQEDLRQKQAQIEAQVRDVVVVGNVPDGFVYREYPKDLYHKDNPLRGRRVRTKEEEAALRKEGGWDDSPAKHGAVTAPEAAFA